MPPHMSTPAPAARLPSQIWYLAWNEAAERFSYYGMTSILTLHLVKNLGLGEHQAISGYQYFVFGVYLTPILGALLSDVLWGRYRTILWLSFGYVAGHATIALWEGPVGLVVGLALIAVGAGGIKPCASAFAADQVPAGDDRAVERVYNLYYWMINLGSFGSTLVIPWLFDAYGPRVAFGVPGLAMALALLVFWVGRGRYVRRPPAVAARAAAAAAGTAAPGAARRGRDGQGRRPGSPSSSPRWRPSGPSTSSTARRGPCRPTRWTAWWPGSRSPPGRCRRSTRCWCWP